MADRSRLRARPGPYSVRTAPLHRLRDRRDRRPGGHPRSPCVRCLPPRHPTPVSRRPPRAAGYDAFGIEPAQRGLERAREIGAPVHAAAIEEAEIAARSLDAVTLWHVLEHVADPLAALQRIAGWLRRGGGLVVGVPNLASVQAQVGGERWYHLDVPRHRTHFTP